jgi:hypothetical protein
MIWFTGSTLLRFLWFYWLPPAAIHYRTVRRAFTLRARHIPHCTPLPYAVHCLMLVDGGGSGGRCGRTFGCRVRGRMVSQLVVVVGQNDGSSPHARSHHALHRYLSTFPTAPHCATPYLLYSARCAIRCLSTDGCYVTQHC